MKTSTLALCSLFLLPFTTHADQPNPYQALFEKFAAAEAAQDWKTQASLVSPDELRFLQQKTREQSGAVTANSANSSVTPQAPISETPEENYIKVREQDRGHPFTLKYLRYRDSNGLFIDYLRESDGSSNENSMQVVEQDGKLYLKFIEQEFKKFEQQHAQAREAMELARRQAEDMERQREAGK